MVVEQGTITVALVTSWSTKTVMASNPREGGNSVIKSIDMVEKGVASAAGGMG
jgi:hypothetical protein